MVIDFHSHILPGIDDGSSSLEESIALLEEEYRQGIHTVVATPHFYARYDDPEQFLKKRARSEAALRQALKARPYLPELVMGAEVYFFSGMSDSEVLSQLTIGKKRCILIEMPQSPWTEAMYGELERIYTRRNLIPIVAHMDRYIRPLATHGIPERLAQLPVMVQANADFFLNPSTRRMAVKLLQEDKIQLLGSDCHNLEHRPPRLDEAIRRIQKKCGDSALHRIRSYQDTLLEGL